MRERELREHAECSLCHKKIGHTGLPLFWTATITRHGLKHGALQRQQGLAMQLGGHAAPAAVMGPDEDMTMTMLGPVTITVCEMCARGRSMPLMAMVPGEKG